MTSGKLSKGDRLGCVDHSKVCGSFLVGLLGIARTAARPCCSASPPQVNYAPFRKNFYIEVPEIARTSDADVAALRKELDGIKVCQLAGAVALACSRPAHCLACASLPPLPRCTPLSPVVWLQVRGANVPKPVKAWTQAGLSSKVGGVRAIILPCVVRLAGAPAVSTSLAGHFRAKSLVLTAWHATSVQLLDTLRKEGFDKPLSIQAQALPIIMSGRCVCARGQWRAGVPAGWWAHAVNTLMRGGKHPPTS